MTPINFSVIWNAEQPDYVTELLERFGKPCRAYRMSWDEAWGELIALTVYKTEIDVSQVAAPWVGNFIAMDALRPFSRNEIASLGGAEAFLPAAWQSSSTGGSKNTWAIPWLVDVRVVYYWRDLLERAGVDEETAFQTPEQVEETCARLQASGITPWVVPTHSQFLTLHNVASWIWGAGNELVSADGKHVLLNQSQARRATRAYFALHRYLPPSTRLLTNADAFRLFTEHRAAATMGPCGWMTTIRTQSTAGDAGATLGITLPPGPPYVGGSNLVIWRHSRHAREAVEFVQFLTGKDAQVEFTPQTGNPPARLDALDEPPYSTDPHYQAIVRALKAGRPFPTFPRWGLVEERASVAFIHVWDDLLTNPAQDTNEVLDRHMEPLIKRLEMTLSSPGL